MISDEDIDRLAAAARMLPLNASTYLEEDFVMNLLETVLDYICKPRSSSRRSSASARTAGTRSARSMSLSA